MEEHGSPLAPRTWLKLGAAFALALAVAYWLPRAASGGTQPPLSMLVVAGALIGALTTAALFLTVRFDLSAPWTVAAYAVGYNALVVLVKFVFGPAGLYEVNAHTDLDSDLGDPVLAVAGAAAVLALYLVAFYAVYWFTKRRLQQVEGRTSITRAWIFLPVVVVGYLLATSGALVVLVLPLIFASAGLEYVSFVFSSSYSLAVGLSLAAATGLAALAFRDVAARAQLVGDLGVLVSFFWLGAAFLVLYHAIWVVYILVITSLWPLRVVVPK